MIISVTVMTAERLSVQNVKKLSSTMGQRGGPSTGVQNSNQEGLLRAQGCIGSQYIVWTGEYINCGASKYFFSF